MCVFAYERKANFIFKTVPAIVVIAVNVRVMVEVPGGIKRFI